MAASQHFRIELDLDSDESIGDAAAMFLQYAVRHPEMAYRELPDKTPLVVSPRIRHVKVGSPELAAQAIHLLPDRLEFFAATLRTRITAAEATARWIGRFDTKTFDQWKVSDCDQKAQATTADATAIEATATVEHEGSASTESGDDFPTPTASSAALDGGGGINENIIKALLDRIASLEQEVDSARKKSVGQGLDHEGDGMVTELVSRAKTLQEALDMSHDPPAQHDTEDPTALRLRLVQHNNKLLSGCLDFLTVQNDMLRAKLRAVRQVLDAGRALGL
jgi:hypothetical protein